MYMHETVGSAKIMMVYSICTVWGSCANPFVDLSQSYLYLSRRDSCKLVTMHIYDFHVAIETIAMIIWTVTLQLASLYIGIVTGTHISLY